MSSRWQADTSMSHAGEEFGGPARRRSGWLIPLAVFFVTACLSALVLAYYFAPAPPGLERVYLSQIENPKGQPGPYGLRQYAFRADSGYHDQDLFVGSDTAGSMVL